MITSKNFAGAAIMLVLLSRTVSLEAAETPVLVAQSQPNKPVPAARAAIVARKLAQEEKTMPDDAAPFEDGAALILNFKPLYRSVFATLSAAHARYPQFLGRQVIDGVPLLIEGNVVLYGQTLAERGSGDTRHNPRLIRGVRVGRRFDELHLVHEAAWAEVEGTPIAIITLHYSDGSSADLPIIYGAHVRGGMRLLTEENEAMTDPNTKVIWRGPGPGSEELHALDRLFKSTLYNPQPDKIVETLDLKSAGAPLASYQLIAATVTLRDPNRPVTPPLPVEATRNFDGRIMVRVVDAASHRAVPNAVVSPVLRVEGILLIGTLLCTSAEGEVTLRYATATTSEISLRARKEGLVSPLAEWQPGVAQITVELPSAVR